MGLIVSKMKMFWSNPINTDHLNENLLNDNDIESNHENNIPTLGVVIPPETDDYRNYLNSYTPENNDFYYRTE